MTEETRNNKVHILTVVIAMVVFLLYSAAMYTYGQTAASTSLEYPTPLLGSQINGKIAARDIGDSRLTSHYYLFETGTGDVFINIEAANLNGDIDVYTAGSMRPLLKASVYATDYATAMQRDFYLRLPSRLILRIQGRTPNDDPATYKISFTGVFKPISAAAAAAMPRDPGPKVTASADGPSATATGAVIEKPKPTPTPKPSPTLKTTPRETVAKNTPKDVKLPKVDPNAKLPKPKLPSPGNDVREEAKKAEAARKEADRRAAAEAAAESAAKKKADDAARAEKAKADKAKSKSGAATGPAKKPPETKAAKPPADPMTEIFLEIEMKNGTSLRYAMSEVFNVSVDNGLVKIVLKNGKLISRNLIDIEEMKIGQ